jgi:hypothetical protein
LYRRFKFPFFYRALAHATASIFYGLRYDADRENVFLDKIKINKSFCGGSRGAVFSKAPPWPPQAKKFHHKIFQSYHKNCANLPEQW